MMRFMKEKVLAYYIALFIDGCLVWIMLSHCQVIQCEARVIVSLSIEWLFIRCFLIGLSYTLMKRTAY